MPVSIQLANHQAGSNGSSEATTAQSQAQLRQNFCEPDAAVLESGADPMADYVAIWMALDSFHQTERLTEEGWSFLSDRLQRPIEMRLLERRPTTLAGAVAALDMATHLMKTFEGNDTAGDEAWYRRLRLHLIEQASQLLHRQVDHLAREPCHNNQTTPSAQRHDPMNATRKKSSDE